MIRRIEKNEKMEWNGIVGMGGANEGTKENNLISLFFSLLYSFVSNLWNQAVTFGKSCGELQFICVKTTLYRQTKKRGSTYVGSSPSFSSSQVILHSTPLVWFPRKKKKEKEKEKKKEIEMKLKCL